METSTEKINRQIAAIKALSDERAQDVLRLRKTMTLQQIADMMGISRERVRQIEAKAKQA